MIQTLPTTTQTIQTTQPSAAKPTVKEPQTLNENKEGLTDRLVRYANYGVGAAGSAAGMLAFPHQIAQTAPQLIQGTTSFAKSMQALGQAHPLLSSGAKIMSSGALKLAKGTQVVSKFSTVVMQTPVIGKLTSPAMAKTMTSKVLPAANAVGAAFAIADNSLRLIRARDAHNTTGQILAGAQIGLNLISGVAGFMPGKAQWVAAGAGLGGLGLELAHQWGGLGKN